MGLLIKFFLIVKEVVREIAWDLLSMVARHLNSTESNTFSLINLIAEVGNSMSNVACSYWMSIGLCHSYLHECVCITSVLKSRCYYVQEEKNCFKILVMFTIMNFFYVSCQVGQAKEMCIAFLEALDETRSVDTIQILLKSFKTGTIGM